MVRLCRERPDRVRGYITVNPNYTDHALGEIERCRSLGLIGMDERAQLAGGRL